MQNYGYNSWQPNSTNPIPQNKQGIQGQIIQPNAQN